MPGQKMGVGALVRNRVFWYGVAFAVAVIAIIAAILALGLGWLHFGPADTVVRHIWIPEPPGTLEKFQTLIAGGFALLGGMGAVYAGRKAYEGAVHAAERTGAATIEAAKTAADAALTEARENRAHEQQKAEAEFERTRRNLTRISIDKVKHNILIIEKLTKSETLHEKLQIHIKKAFPKIGQNISIESNDIIVLKDININITNEENFIYFTDECVQLDKKISRYIVAKINKDVNFIDASKYFLDDRLFIHHIGELMNNLLFALKANTSHHLTPPAAD